MNHTPKWRQSKLYIERNTVSPIYSSSRGGGKWIVNSKIEHVLKTKIKDY